MLNPIRRLLQVACFLMISVFLCPSIHAKQLKLEAPEELAKLITKNLPDLEKTDIEKFDHTKMQTLLRDLRKKIGIILATEGYFSPEISLSSDTQEKNKEAPMILHVEPGSRTMVSEVKISFRGPAPLPTERETELRQLWPLTVGKPFRQSDWENSKNLVLNELMSKDYALAEIDQSTASIDPETKQASLAISFKTGPRIIIGEIRIDGLQNQEQWLIERYNQGTIKSGDRYDENAFHKFQTALQSSPYFSQVLIELDLPTQARAHEIEESDNPDETSQPVVVKDQPFGASETTQAMINDLAAQETETKIIPVSIKVRERQPHRIGLGVGISSNTGLRTEFTYHSTHIFGQPWELNSGLRIEQKKQSAFGDIFLPPELNGARYSFGANFEHTDIEGLDTQKIAVGAMRTQKIGPFDTNLGFNLQREKQKPDGADESTQTALALLSGVTWRKLDSIILPRNGHIVRLEVGGGAKALLSDQDFLRLYGRYQGYFPVGKRDVFSLRGEIGATLAESSQGIPQDYLFRTGGTQSVRGYGYQSLGVENGNAIVGGRYLTVASVEYTHWLPEPSNFGIAAFVDAGNAANSWPSLAIGAGLGVRYLTPAGPVAVDLAYGFDGDQRSSGLQLHFTLAIPF